MQKISTEVQKEQLALDSQLAEVKKMDAELASKRDALDPADAAGKQAITEEEAKRDDLAETYNTRLRALREQGKTFDEGRAAWVQRCTTRDYDETGRGRDHARAQEGRGGREVTRVLVLTRRPFPSRGGK